MTYSDAEVMDKGMDILEDALGFIEMEHFISVIKRDKFDYETWSHEFFDKMTPEEIEAAAVAYNKAHPAQHKNLKKKS